jgi:uncharacterized protein YjbI with pentapeptide repeats
MTDPRKNLIRDDADLRDHDFSGAILEGVICISARFDGSSFRGADLYWAIAFEASFADCDFTDADLRGANLMEANFANAQLIRTNFGRNNLGGSTKLQGADLSTATIQYCRFEGAQYDATTRFPKGFDPQKHGLQLAEQGA